MSGDYTVDESARTVEILRAKDILSVSLKGKVSGGIVGDFRVVSAEARR
jgi:hypothetical protein